MQQESLKNKTIKGVGWSAADAFLGQGVTFIAGLVLARLLSPDEYELIGICLIFTTGLNGIVVSGFSNNPFIFSIRLVGIRKCILGLYHQYNSKRITNLKF